MRADDSFAQGGMDRQLLLWALATRQQLERWEPLVAQRIRAELTREAFPDALIWQAATEHHFLLVAAAQLLRVIAMSKRPLTVDPVVRDETKEGRDLLEHWDQNAPIFNVFPRDEERISRQARRYPSVGKFAERNPKRGPFWWFGWDGHRGPAVMPNVPASALHDLVDRVEAAVLAENPGWERFIRARQPSPWAGGEYGDDRWWPRPTDA